MATNNDQVLFTYSMDNKSCMTTQEECAHPLMAGHDVVPRVANDYAVRRLTPTECERLQGFEDNWTRIPYKKKPAEDCPDGPRYKTLGNSMAVPCMRWIGERIQAVEDERMD